MTLMFWSSVAASMARYPLLYSLLPGYEQL
jgi:hypothetical protein